MIPSGPVDFYDSKDCLESTVLYLAAPFVTSKDPRISFINVHVVLFAIIHAVIKSSVCLLNRLHFFGLSESGFFD